MVNFSNFIFWWQQQGRGAGLAGFIPLIIIFAIFYLLLIRPMRAKQKKLRQLIENLRNGDKIISTGGIYGTVLGITEDTILLKIADNIKIVISRNAVAGLQPEKK